MLVIKLVKYTIPKSLLHTESVLLVDQFLYLVIIKVWSRTISINNILEFIKNTKDTEY